MDLYLIRHAEAMPLGVGNISADEDRPLTEAGHEQARALAVGLRRWEARLDFVVSSPLRRAVQTAEGLIQNWPEAPELRTCSDLAPGGKRRKVARFLEELGAEGVALVGHMPDLAMLTGWLIGSKNVRIDFAKAGAALVRCDTRPDKGAGDLVWMAPPEWMK